MNLLIVKDFSEIVRLRRRSINVRRGFTAMELIGTLVLLAVLFSIVMPMILLVAHERRATAQRQVAMQHAANLLERAARRGWSGLEPGDQNVPEPDADLKAILPGLEQTIVVKQLEGDLESRQITASVGWQNRTGQLVPPIRLSAWIYQMNEEPRK